MIFEELMLSHKSFWTIGTGRPTPKERLTNRLRGRQAGAVGAQNRHGPRVRSGSEHAARTHLTTARDVLLAAPRTGAS